MENPMERESWILKNIQLIQKGEERNRTHETKGRQQGGSPRLTTSAKGLREQRRRDEGMKMADADNSSVGLWEWKEAAN